MKMKKDSNGKNHIVGQVVPKPEFIGREDEIIETLCLKYNLEAIKIYGNGSNNKRTRR